MYSHSSNFKIGDLLTDLGALITVLALLFASFSSGAAIAEEEQLETIVGTPTETPSENNPCDTCDSGVENSETGGGGEGGEANGTTVIDTGDAAADSSVVNEVNTNNTNTEGTSDQEPAPEPTTDSGTSTPEIIHEPILDVPQAGSGQATSTPPVTEGNATSTNSGQATSTPQVDTSSTSTPELITDENASSTPSATSTPAQTGTSTLLTLPEDDGENASTTVTNKNDAEVGNDVDVEAGTGENEINDNEGDAYIFSGDAIANANVLNVVNTNIFNSYGLFLFLSNLFGGFGDLDLRSLGFLNAENIGVSETNGEVSNEDKVCQTECGDGGSLHIKNENNVGITNDVIVRSSTGENEIDGGNGAIYTGDAYSAANVINVANTNIVDSNYLLFTFNNFGSWAGDLVLPNKNIFSSLFGEGFGVGGNTKIKNKNEAEIENTVTSGADTGKNHATGTADGSVISTGHANSTSNVVNQVNTNIFGSDSFAIMFKIHGNWNGNVWGAPQGVNWVDSGDGGLYLFFDQGAHGTYADDILGGGLENYSSTTIQNSNKAKIKNNIDVFALTGENKIDGSGATIKTGDAYAAANVVNVANTNVVGRNWLLAIVNIFGDWGGDIQFGRPDLWVGSRAELMYSHTGPGSKVKYNLTVMNNGDAEATDVRLKDLFDDHFINILNDDGIVDFGTFERSIIWDIGTLAPGDIFETSYTVQIKDNTAPGTILTNTSTVSANEPDEKLDDNSDSVSITSIPKKNTGSTLGGPTVHYKPMPDLKIYKSNTASTSIYASSTVSYEIKVVNEGVGPAFNSVLIDTLSDDNGNIVNEEIWNLDKIYVGEEIIITYDVNYNASTTPGEYLNSAHIKAYGGTPWTVPFYGSYITTVSATSSVMVIGEISVALEENVHESEEKNIEEEEETVEVVESETELIPPVAVIEETGTQKEPWSITQGVSLHPTVIYPVYIPPEILGEVENNAGRQLALLVRAIELPELLLMLTLILLMVFFLANSRDREKFTKFASSIKSFFF